MDPPRLRPLCESVAATILNNPEDWERRDEAVLQLAEHFSGLRDAELGGTTDEWKQLWRGLKEPFRMLLGDLRSELVRDACSALVAMAAATRDQFRPLFREILGSLLGALAGGNKVIKRHVDECVDELLQHCRYKGAVALVSEKMTTSRAKIQRESCARFLGVMLEHWGPKYFHDASTLDAIGAALSAGVRDASEVVRRTSRLNFARLYHKSRECQRKAEELLTDMEPRTLAQVRFRVGV
uniref:TOG domain-containing protein n=1 Tax=Phaeomonas parva TaxID=124430 RepID=A0A7S1XRA8_9STRA|mmetsp:Transcript_27174/g.85507  ORF Transcript_27174/g.85507 Transcript_27174/m.85507 type:complete len:240 (+) Transcript_27174:115-834(+)